MKKVVHVIASLNDGGAEGALYRLCRYDTGRQHIVVSLMDEGKYGPMLREAGIKVVCLRMKQGKVSFGGLWNLWRLLRSDRQAIVQTWMYHADLLGGVIAKLAGIKKIYWGVRHTDFDPKHTKRSTLVVVHLCAVLSSYIPTKIVCCANRAKDVHSRYGYADKKLIVAQNGYDLKRLQINEPSRLQLRAEWDVGDRFLLGMVGRFHTQKDHKNLLNAVAHLKHNGFDILTVLVGSGLTEANKTLTAWIGELGLSDNILLLGQRTDVPEIMNALDIHVLSSNTGEAFPNVVAEAMACGAPVVTTDVGDAALIVGGTGWVVSPNDPYALASAIIEAYSASRDKVSWAARRNSARTRIQENFSIASMISRFDAIWSSHEV